MLPEQVSICRTCHKKEKKRKKKKQKHKKTSTPTRDRRPPIKDDPKRSNSQPEHQHHTTWGLQGRAHMLVLCSSSGFSHLIFCHSTSLSSSRCLHNQSVTLLNDYCLGECKLRSGQRNLWWKCPCTEKAPSQTSGNVFFPDYSLLLWIHSIYRQGKLKLLVQTAFFQESYLHITHCIKKKKKSNRLLLVHRLLHWRLTACLLKTRTFQLFFCLKQGR